jgi:hypothetical protein
MTARSSLSFFVLLFSAATALIAPSPAQSFSAPPGIEIVSPPPQKPLAGVVEVRVAAPGNATAATCALSGASLGSEVIIGSTDTQVPYAFRLDTTAFADGSYTLSANASGSGGAAWSSSIPIVIANGTTPSPASGASFVSPTITTYTLTEGEVLRLDLRAHDPADGALSYSVTKSTGNVAWAALYESGRVFRFAATAAELGAGGTAATHTFTFSAFDSSPALVATLAIQVTVNPRGSPDAPILRTRRQNGAAYEFLAQDEINEYPRKAYWVNNAEISVSVEQKIVAGDPAPTVSWSYDSGSLQAITMGASQVITNYPWMTPAWKLYRNKCAPLGSVPSYGRHSVDFSATDANGTSAQRNYYEIPEGRNTDDRIQIVPLIDGVTQWGAGPQNQHMKPAPTLTTAVNLTSEFRLYSGALYTPSGGAWVEYRVNDISLGAPQPSTSAVCFDPSTFPWPGAIPASAAISAHVVDAADPALDRRWHPRLVTVGIGASSQTIATTQQVPAASMTYMEFEASERFDSFTWSGTYDGANIGAHPFTSDIDPNLATAPPPGRPGANWWLVPLSNEISGLYTSEPHLYRNAQDKLVAFLHQTARLGDQSDTAVVYHNRLDWWCGPRGAANISPFSTIIPHPDDRGWVGVDVGGRVFRVMPDGMVVTLLGTVNKRYGANLPPLLHTIDPPAPFTLHLGDKDIVGNFFDLDTVFRPLDTPNDLAFIPGSSNILFIADSHRNRIAAVDLTACNANPTAPNACDGNPLFTAVGVPDAPLGAVTSNGFRAYVDGAANVCTFNEPYSLVVAPATGAGQFGYIADKKSKAIRRVNIVTGMVDTVVGGTRMPSGAPSRTAFDQAWYVNGVQVPPTSNLGTVQGTFAGGSGAAVISNTLLANGPASGAFVDSPSCVRLDSQGRVVWLEDGIRAIRRYDPVLDTVQFIARVDGTVTAQDSWLWLDVDKGGILGPGYDDILVSMSQGSSQSTIKRIASDGTYFNNFPQDMPGSHFSGRGDRINPDSRGHYPWVLAIDDHEPRVLTGGFGSVGLAMLRAKVSTDVLNDNQIAYLAGLDLMNWGTVDAFPRHSRPSFTALHGLGGHHRLDNAMPNFGDLTPANIGAFIQGGMSGTVPRPEFSGRDLDVMTYYVKRRTNLGLTATLPAAPGTYADATTPAIDEIVVGRSSTATSGFVNLDITWRTSEATIGTVTIGHYAFDYLTRFYDVENAYVTGHQLLLEHVPASKDMFIIITARDSTGNVTRRRL